ncbi:MAG: HDOD domain-containing protein [Proteobacteria bacterium]|nr:HDOD domain-containing protein [Pseudomonadota bacterium]
MLTPLNNQCAPTLAIGEYLRNSGANYMVIDHLPNHTLDEITALVNLEEFSLLRTVLVKAEDGLLMIILPEDYFFDIGAFSQVMNRTVHPLSDENLLQLFSSLKIESVPPFPDFVGVEAIVEKRILSLNEVYIRPSIDNALIGMKGKDFLKLLQAYPVLPVGFPLSQLNNFNHEHGCVSESIKKLTPLRIKQRVKETVELPAIPAIAHKILKLRFNFQTTTQELAQTIEKDPSLAAQLMSWARSPYYGYAGKIGSLEEAIVKVLGFDLVMNLALGIILGRTMQVKVQGPLGLRAYWEFAITCAALVETIVKLIPPASRPLPGLAYLGGLLHNFGHLLLAQVFPPYFELLSQYVQVNPHANIKAIENYVLGIGHDEIGAWLMQSWHLPPEVIAAISHHHDEEYEGEYAVYPNIVLLATRLLKRQGIGDADSVKLPEKILEKLQLNENDLTDALEYVMSQREDLFELAAQVVPT